MFIVKTAKCHQNVTRYPYSKIPVFQDTRIPDTRIPRYPYSRTPMLQDTDAPGHRCSRTPLQRPSCRTMRSLTQCGRRGIVRAAAGSRLLGMYSALFTPRISLDQPKTVICACPSGPGARGQTGMCTSSGGTGGYGEGCTTGWVLPSCRVWYCQGPTNAMPGAYRVPSRHSRPLLGPPHT